MARGWARLSVARNAANDSAGCGRQVMQTDIELKWIFGFMPLAIRRSVLLFAEAGLPSGVVRSPSGLLRVAGRFVRTARGLSGDPDEWSSELFADREPAHRRESGADPTTQLIELGFTRLADIYDDETSNIIRRWMERYVVDDLQRQNWQAWSELFMLTPSSYHAGHLTFPLPFARYISDRLIACIERYYNPKNWENLQILANRAREMPLSPEEESLLVLLAEDVESKPEIMDVIQDMTLVTLEHRAYTVWSEIKVFLDKEDQTLLVNWAKLSRTYITLPNIYE